MIRLPKKQRKAKALLDLVSAVQELHFDIFPIQVDPSTIKCGSPHIVSPHIAKLEIENHNRLERVLGALAGVKREYKLNSMSKEVDKCWTKLWDEQNERRDLEELCR